MLPGYLAGHYTYDDCHIDLARLARYAGARLVHCEARGIDTKVRAQGVWAGQGPRRCEPESHPRGQQQQVHVQQTCTRYDRSPPAQLGGCRPQCPARHPRTPQAQRVLLPHRPPIPYDVLSLNTGIVPAPDAARGAAEHATPVKPINT